MSKMVHDFGAILRKASRVPCLVIRMEYISDNRSQPYWFTFYFEGEHETAALTCKFADWRVFLDYLERSAKRRDGRMASVHRITFMVSPELSSTIWKDGRRAHIQRLGINTVFPNLGDATR